MVETVIPPKYDNKVSLYREFMINYNISNNVVVIPPEH
jgi:hypothetical protein